MKYIEPYADVERWIPPKKALVEDPMLVHMGTTSQEFKAIDKYIEMAQLEGEEFYDFGGGIDSAIVHEDLAGRVAFDNLATGGRKYWLKSLKRGPYETRKYVGRFQLRTRGDKRRWEFLRR